MSTRGIFHVVLVFVLAAAAGALRAEPGDFVYARPGALLDAGTTRLNFYCMGTGSPTVVFDAGFSDWSPAWVKVQPRVAQWTRACSYDRAGSGFSEAAVLPRTGTRIADELHAALRNGGIPGPYILVGSAYGGNIARTFAQRHRGETAGLVLVDADATDREPKALQDDDHRSHRDIPIFFRACRDAVLAGRPLEISAPAGSPPDRCDTSFFRGLPERTWSPELNEKVMELTRSKAAMYDAIASEMEEVPRGEAYLQEHEGSLGSRPVRVLTSGHHGGGPRGGTSTPEGRRYQDEVTKAQASWLRLSSNSKQLFARESPDEYIQLEQPDLVVQAIREVYDAGRP
ncbi:MAG TPA: alpha/beta hydrolase [Usitatibacter sp.]|nr:alpha/beta hydrolase [Usitatibacter sp.]